MQRRQKVILALLIVIFIASILIFAVGDSTPEAGNEDEDGDGLPAYIEQKINTDPRSKDTDKDGLTDSFELLKLGLLTDARSADTDGDGVSDADEDLDEDGLTNIEEQKYGTDPLVVDTDKDTLSDGTEISFGSDPLLKDSDGDGLEDDSELRLGTDPTNPDTDGDGIVDGEEIYTSTKVDEELGVKVALTGRGDLAKHLKIYNASWFPLNKSALVSPVVKLRLDELYEPDLVSASITLPYSPEVEDPYNLSIYYYNETLGTFVKVPSVVDPVNRTVTGEIPQLSICVIFHVPTWDAIFEVKMKLG